MTAREDIIITFDEAVKILKDELKYPEEKALHFVRKFDRNNDNKLSMAEFSAFRKNIEETKNTVVPKFKQYDRDGNGYVSLAEARSILQQPPFQFSPEKIVFLLKKYDVDGNNKLDIEEFANFYSEIKATNENLTATFDQLDKDGNGILTSDEIISAIQEGLHCDLETAQCMMSMFDKNRDGTLDKSEFIQMWSYMSQ